MALKLLILVEGIDGSGKGYFSEHLTTLYQNLGYKTQRLKFPTVYPPLDLGLYDLIDYYSQNYEETLGTLDSDLEVLVCDRSWLTTLAYQGFSRIPDQLNKAPINKQSFDLITKACEKSFDQLQPEHTEVVYLKTDISVCVSRIRHRKDSNDVLDHTPPKILYKKLYALQTAYEFVLNCFNVQWFESETFRKAKVIKLNSSYEINVLTRQYRNLSYDISLFSKNRSTD